MVQKAKPHEATIGAVFAVQIERHTSCSICIHKLRCLVSMSYMLDGYKFLLPHPRHRSTLAPGFVQFMP